MMVLNLDTMPKVPPRAEISERLEDLRFGVQTSETSRRYSSFCRAVVARSPLPRKAGLRTFFAMRLPRLLLCSVLALGGALTSPATALDPAVQSGSESGPFELFALGFRAYQRGEKVEAMEALRFAAEKGHAGARWKLGRMYADGDGIPENDFEAYKIFERIVQEQDDENVAYPNSAYVSSSIVALAGYLRRGIPDSPVKVDLPRARQFYFHAASYFGNTEAQFELGRMILKGEGGKANPRQAARWLKLAAEKNNSGAQALLGYLLFNGEEISVRPEPARGLAMLTVALRHAKPSEEAWIRPMQEEAFSLASENDRRTALAYAEQHGTPDAVSRN